MSEQDAAPVLPYFGLEVSYVKHAVDRNGNRVRFAVFDDDAVITDIVFTPEKTEP